MVGFYLAPEAVATETEILAIFKIKDSVARAFANHKNESNDAPRMCSSYDETYGAILQSVTTGGSSQERVYALTGCYSSCAFAKYEVTKKVKTYTNLATLSGLE